MSAPVALGLSGLLILLLGIAVAVYTCGMPLGESRSQAGGIAWFLVIVSVVCGIVSLWWAV